LAQQREAARVAEPVPVVELVFAQEAGHNHLDARALGDLSHFAIYLSGSSDDHDNIVNHISGYYGK